MEKLASIDNRLIAFIEKDGIAFISTLNLSIIFNKRHDLIIDFIKTLPAGEFFEKNFKQDNEAYLISKDGFCLLSACLTHKRAHICKIDILRAFDKMSELIKAKR